MFSGGSYGEVARWLGNFLTSHAKRENPRVEVALDAGDEREGRSYGVRFRVGRRLGPVTELDYRDVADHRETLAWCRASPTGRALRCGNSESAPAPPPASRIAGAAASARPGGWPAGSVAGDLNGFLGPRPR